MQQHNSQLFEDQEIRIERPITMEGGDEEMISFVDDPSLFEFNEMMQSQADPDIYDAAPMPKDWDMGLSESQMVDLAKGLEGNGPSFSDTPIGTVPNQTNLGQPSMMTRVAALSLPVPDQISLSST